MLLVQRRDRVEAGVQPRLFLPQGAGQVHVDAVRHRDVVAALAVQQQLPAHEGVDRPDRRPLLVAGVLEQPAAEAGALAAGADGQQRRRRDHLALGVVRRLRQRRLGLEPALVGAADAAVGLHRRREERVQLVHAGRPVQAGAVDEGEHRPLVLRQPRRDARQGVQRQRVQRRRRRKGRGELGVAGMPGEQPQRPQLLGLSAQAAGVGLDQQAVPGVDDRGDQAVDLLAVLDEADRLEAAFDLAQAVARALADVRGVIDEVLVQQQR
ncbi:MAG: hypothetical protein ISN26_05360 [Betaproteobacteria bacterium AqS2]|uniref:Uncharacterized protein n=1 Tax=Candidatus Amphirhobacter heronislandensis TaxID=1732024 RepID=A0A930XY99_9GAMM|nr:hypothetical protein [Betaproteobacteria bacterium AqS2]